MVLQFRFETKSRVAKKLKMLRTTVSRLGQVKGAIRFQKRNAGGWFKKNIRVEENAGLREISYKTWEYDTGSLGRLFAILIIPSALVYNLMIQENVSFIGPAMIYKK